MMTWKRNDSELNHDDHTQQAAKFRSALPVAFILLAVCVGLPVSAAAGPITENLDAPIVIGNTAFEPGTLVLAPATVGNVQSVMIDGRQVATVFRHAADRVPAAAVARFVFRADEQGNLHLVGLRWSDPQTGRTEERHFRIAAVASASSRDESARRGRVDVATLRP